LESCAKRNVELPKLLKTRDDNVDDDDDDDDVVAHKVARTSRATKSPSCTHRASKTAPLPSLLLVARQTPRMAPTLKFSGLLAFSKHIGPKVPVRCRKSGTNSMS
jgi:hypothetical protein